MSQHGSGWREEPSHETPEAPGDGYYVTVYLTPYLLTVSLFVGRNTVVFCIENNNAYVGKFCGTIYRVHFPLIGLMIILNENFVYITPRSLRVKIS